MKKNDMRVGDTVKILCTGKFQGKEGIVTSIGKGVIPIHVTFEGRTHETDFAINEIKFIKRIANTIDIEPTWEFLCDMAARGILPAANLLPACKISYKIKQSQKQGKKAVTFLFMENDALR